MRTGRWQWVAAAWAVCGQPGPTVGAELPVRFDLAAAIEALVEELVKFLLELQECGLLPAFLGLFLFVHGVPSVFHTSWALVSRIIDAPSAPRTLGVGLVPAHLPTSAKLG